MRFLFGILLALTLLSPTRAASCLSEAQVLDGLKSQSEWHVLPAFTRAQTAAAVELFDSMPPASVSDFDLARLVAGPRNTGVLLLGHGGLFCTALRIDAEHFSRIESDLLGEDI